MRFPLFFALVLTISLIFTSPARAGYWGEFMCWWVPCTGSGDEEFSRPNLHDGKTPHNIEWTQDDWTPEDWVDEDHTAQDVISGFHKAGIITDQDTYSSGDVDIEVGQGFMRLSTLDKARVIRFVDTYSEYTKKFPDAVIFLTHKASGDSIGTYSASGLQLQ